MNGGTLSPKSGAGGGLFVNIPQRYIIVLLTFVCAAICYIERIGFPVAYTAVAIRAGIDQATKGWVLSSFYYGYASSQVPGSWAAQKYGGRRVLTYSFTGWFLLCILTPLEPGSSTALLVLLRLTSGMVQGFIFPAIHTVLAQWVPPHEKSRSVSLSMSGQYFGAGFAMMVLPTLVANHGPETVFHLVAATGVVWTALWVRYASDPPGGATAFAHSMQAIDSPRKEAPSYEDEEYGVRRDKEDGGGGNSGLPLGSPVKSEGGRFLHPSSHTLTHTHAHSLTHSSEAELRRGKVSDMDGGTLSARARKASAVTAAAAAVGVTGSSSAGSQIPWIPMLMSGPVWAIIFNNFTFHYALYVLMNWLPTFFDQALKVSLHSIGPGKSMPYHIMGLFSNVGGVAADYLVTRRILSVTATRKFLNTVGFLVSAVALALTPVLASVRGAILCSSITLGACAIARAGFAVNHMDIAPRYAGVVMGISNTFGTIAGVVGVAATGLILEAAGVGESGAGDAKSLADTARAEAVGWWWVFMTPSLLCVASAAVFAAFATGERIFD